MLGPAAAAAASARESNFQMTERKTRVHINILSGHHNGEPGRERHGPRQAGRDEKST